MQAFETEIINERYELVIDRVIAIKREVELEEPLLSYFRKTAEFIEKLNSILIRTLNGGVKDETLDNLRIENSELYSDLIELNYVNSYANPDYIRECLLKTGIPKADEMARILCFVYSEIRGLIPYVYEGDKEVFTIYIELFAQLYAMFVTAKEENRFPSADSIKECIYWFESDNCDIIVPKRVDALVNPENSFARDIIMNEDLNNERYLYLFGEYITENEVKTCQFINTLSEDELQSMADTFTEGYRIGFVKAGKPIDKKTSVNIRYSLGFEKITKKAIENFEKMGLKSVIYRAASLSLNKKGQAKIGYYGGNPNRQYDFDHKDDDALYLDADFVTRKIEVLKDAYEAKRELANGHAGPAVQEVFGEIPFTPVSKVSAITHNDKSRKAYVDYQSKAATVVNEYIIGKERSFTIIAYPMPSIGDQYEEIFSQTVKLNTLDYKLYEQMHQKLIDVLDKADKVRIIGKGENHTDIVVALHTIEDAAKETNFENCVADVNIPVGEVFTSPILKGTNGLLHVTKVYLNELLYKDFELQIVDGCVKEYNCANFDNDEENKKYIKDNFLYSHETLPMGEFAIGTNTVAYRMTRDFEIEDRLPILIGEKTGPHFAFGDTCYSHEEDVKVYNPDGKEIIARDNEISKKRNISQKEAYFNCHTDVTIPYDELGGIYAITPSGEVPIFENGEFVVKGCESLNIPLKQ